MINFLCHVVHIVADEGQFSVNILGATIPLVVAVHRPQSQANSLAALGERIHFNNDRFRWSVSIRLTRMLHYRLTRVSRCHVVNLRGKRNCDQSTVDAGCLFKLQFYFGCDRMRYERRRKVLHVLARSTCDLALCENASEAEAWLRNS
ncbi:hypothetical protein Rcae01_06540 [Novipirellula caenicola]|uniref:Uncharacterized protein n=1 Tax=Novipirellula caenicola TaxID=1536901 RepID=A0ABP9W4D5_9BACT